MPNSENSIVIDSGKVLITERKKPMRILFYLAVFLFGMQAVFMIIEYQSTKQWYDLVLGGILAFCVGLIVSREMFFRTHRNEIDVKEISGVKIQKVLFGNGNVYLKLILKNKIREIFIDQHRAEEIRKELDSHA
jgi:hypothetical protein